MFLPLLTRIFLIMKTKLLFGILIIGTLVSSCYTEVFIEDDFVETGVSIDAAIHAYDLWYVDINETRGNGEVPFLQRAFTITFDNGSIYANNNIVGIGKTGGGYGIEIGYFDIINGGIRVRHTVDGNWPLEVFVVNAKSIELYDATSDTSYFLRGYSQRTFDYDTVFYDNMKYFLQEYDAWEKTYTSQEGALNDFDAENYVQFFSSPSRDIFKSSIDENGTYISNLVWDYEGDYQVYDIENDFTLKTLTLDYGYLGDDYFELYVINDSTIELYHPTSGTVYEFRGKGYIQYLKSGKSTSEKKRVKSTNKVMNVTRQRVN